MLSKTKSKNAAIAARSAALPSIPKELIDLFVTGPMSGDAVNAASVAFKKALIERAMGAELSHHLGYPPGAAKPEDASNHRNGTSGKTVLTDAGSLRIEVPRDHEGSFEPALIPKHERGFDDKIIAAYARGMTMREVQGFLLESYGDTWASASHRFGPRAVAPITPPAGGGCRSSRPGGSERSPVCSSVNPQKSTPTQLEFEGNREQHSGRKPSIYAGWRIFAGPTIYFGDPRSPWQRGTNENTNGLPRQYFPKGTDLNRYGERELDAVALALNDRPRKTLGWKTPAEALDALLSAAQSTGVATTP